MRTSSETFFFRGKSLFKNNLTCKNVAAGIYSSCTLPLMGFWCKKAQYLRSLNLKIILETEQKYKHNSNTYTYTGFFQNVIHESNLIRSWPSKGSIFRGRGRGHDLTPDSSYFYVPYLNGFMELVHPSMGQSALQRYECSLFLPAAVYPH